MRKTLTISSLLWLGLLPGVQAAGPEKAPNASLWQDPSPIAARDLIYGAGGKEHAPGSGTYTFLKEDLDGNSPKFVVKDQEGVEWKVKIGAEARAETAATRLVWAMGYATDEDYLLPAVRVSNMPSKLNRGSESVSADGTVRDARWERMGHKKQGIWRWRKNPFSKTRELDGLRVMMALLNNYDMKDSQNSVYLKGDTKIYLVSDLGATLGSTGSSWPKASIKGNAERYAQADFIKKVSSHHVDFAAPSWPMMVGFIPTPPFPYSWFTVWMKLFGHAPATNVFMQRWIGKGVAREHVYWMGGMLAQLTP